MLVCNVSYCIRKPESIVARPRKEKTLQALSVRLPGRMLDEVDACAARLKSQTPLLEVNRTDAVRYLLQLGLQADGNRERKRKF